MISHAKIRIISETQKKWRGILEIPAKLDKIANIIIIL